jgi:hypothetical protein
MRGRAARGPLLGLAAVVVAAAMLGWWMRVAGAPGGARGLTGSTRPAVAPGPPEAMRALRSVVGADEVPDSQVKVIFWSKLQRRADVYVGGFWLDGRQGLAVLWNCSEHARAAALVATVRRFKSSGLAEEKAGVLVREHFKWMGQPVVPVGAGYDEGGALEVDYVDGWDAGCDLWSHGTVDVDLQGDTITPVMHVK